MKVKVKDWLNLTSEQKIKMLRWLAKDETKRAVELIDDYYRLYPDYDL